MGRKWDPYVLPTVIWCLLYFNHTIEYITILMYILFLLLFIEVYAHIYAYIHKVNKVYYIHVDLILYFDPHV